MQGRFIRIVNARHPLELAGSGELVQAFRIASFADLQRGINEDLQKVTRTCRVRRCPRRAANDPANAVAVSAIGADKSGQRDQAGVAKQFRDTANPTNVFLPVLRSKGQTESAGKALTIFSRQPIGTGIQTVADVVSIEQVAGNSALGEQGINRIGDRALAAATESGKPDNAAALPLDGVFVPTNQGLIGREWS